MHNDEKHNAKCKFGLDNLQVTILAVFLIISLPMEMMSLDSKDSVID